MAADRRVVLVGRRLSPEAHLLRDFFTRADQPFDWLDPDGAGWDAGDVMLRHGLTAADLPAVEIDGEVVLRHPTLVELADALGDRGTPRREHYDLAIVGAGPAGLAAAVYAASDGLSVVVSERDLPGGQASHTSLIENYFGFPDGIAGATLARRGGRQAQGFDADLLILRGVVDGGLDGRGFRFALAGGGEVTADVAICAVGATWRRLDAPGLEELTGRGVYYGAGRSEAKRCRGEPVVIVGGGNSAGQAAMTFAAHTDNVTMVVRGPSLSASLSGYLVDRITAHPGIDVRLGTRVTGVTETAGRLSYVHVESADGAEAALPATALFVCIGGVPNTDWAHGGGIVVDQAGYLVTGPDLVRGGAPPAGWPLDRDPLPLEASFPGFFVAGDVRHGSTKRVASAVGEGAMAVAQAHQRLGELSATAARG